MKCLRNEFKSQLVFTNASLQDINNLGIFSIIIHICRKIISFRTINMQRQKSSSRNVDNQQKCNLEEQLARLH